MRYRSQSVAYWYFAVAMVLFGLQIVFGLLSASKYWARTRCSTSCPSTSPRPSTPTC